MQRIRNLLLPLVCKHRGAMNMEPFKGLSAISAALVAIVVECQMPQCDPNEDIAAIFSGSGAEWTDMSYAYDETGLSIVVGAVRR